jgi:hypothetical protein
VTTQTFITFDFATNRHVLKTATVTGGTPTQAGAIVGLDANGRIDVSLMPGTIGSLSFALSASEALTAGDWTNAYWDSTNSIYRVRKALATDVSKPTNSFVLDTVAQSGTVTVYFSGANTAIVATGFTNADEGKPIFLSAATSGASTKSAPSSTGNLIQRLGLIATVGSFVTVNMDLGLEILVG